MSDRTSDAPHPPQHRTDGLYEWYEGRYQKVLHGDRYGWWRYHEHYDRNGYCDNPARGY